MSHSSILPDSLPWEGARIYLGLDSTQLYWYGGHAVHVYVDGREVDVFHVGSFEREHATIAEVAEGMLSWVKENLREEVKA
jgi:hypothetical protein